jgi:hypothetical protein
LLYELVTDGMPNTVFGSIEETYPKGQSGYEPSLRIACKKIKFVM